MLPISSGFVVRNTFVELAEAGSQPESSARLRSSSTPRNWSPATVTISRLREFELFSFSSNDSPAPSFASACSELSTSSSRNSPRAGGEAFCTAADLSLPMRGRTEEPDSAVDRVRSSSLVTASPPGSPRWQLPAVPAQCTASWPISGLVKMEHEQIEQVLSYLGSSRADAFNPSASSFASDHSDRSEDLTWHSISTPSPASDARALRASADTPSPLASCNAALLKQNNMCESTGDGAESGFGTPSTRTRLTSQARSCKPVPMCLTSAMSGEVEALPNSRLTAVVNAVQLVLAANPLLHQVQISNDMQGGSALISVQMAPTGNAQSMSYDLLQTVRSTMEAVTTRLGTVRLVSARSQKDESSYALRSKFACIPDVSSEGMCWDFVRKGYCPRGSNCRWSHPQNEDSFRIKVVVTYAAKGVPLDVQGEQQKEKRSSSGESCRPARHKISLEQLVE